MDNFAFRLPAITSRHTFRSRSGCFAMLTAMRRASVVDDIRGLRKTAIMDWLISRYTVVARTLAWIGILAIIVLSVVPANDRPVSGVGQGFEHFTAFALVGGAFAIGYRFSLIRLLVLAVFFCGGIELLQVPLPTRHARVSDFLVDSVGLVLRYFVFLSRNRFGL